MNKAHEDINWQDLPIRNTPLAARNLNKMDHSIDVIDDRVIALDSGKVGSVEVTNTLQSGDTIATITVDGTETDIKSAQVEVDEEPSATSTNPLQNKAIYAMLNNLLPEGSESGNPISIDDASGLSAKACSVDLLPIQDLHGYDSPWVGGAGKNKLPNKASSSTVSGITFTVNNDGTIVANGTATSTLTFVLQTYQKLSDYGLTTEQYRLSGGYGTSSAYIMLGVNGSGNEWRDSSGSGAIFTPTAEDLEKQYMAIIIIANGTTLNNAKFYPMICLRSESTDYAPYSNICPISGRNSVEVKRTGKNLCNPADIYVFNSNRYFATTNYATRPSIQVAPNTQYILSCRKGVTPGDYSIYYWDIEGEFISGQKADPFTTPSNCVGISFYCGYADGDFTNVDNVKAQVEEGSTATAYEAYNGHTYTESLGSTYYGGKVDFVSGEVVIDRAVVDLGDLSWGIGNSGQPTQYFYSSALTDYKYINDSTVNYIFEQYRAIPVSQRYIDGTGFINSGKSVAIKDDNYSTKEAFKASVTGYKVCYELATPIELTLTPQEIELLKGNNVLTTDGNSIKLVYSADIKAFIESQLQNS